MDSRLSGLAGCASSGGRHVAVLAGQLLQCCRAYQVPRACNGSPVDHSHPPPFSEHLHTARFQHQGRTAAQMHLCVCWFSTPTVCHSVVRADLLARFADVKVCDGCKLKRLFCTNSAQ